MKMFTMIMLLLSVHLSAQVVEKFTIEANKAWTSTIYVEKGEKIQISASGKWVSDPNYGSISVMGHDNPLLSDKAPIKGANHGILVGRIEGGRPFVVGEYKELEVERTGLLQFMMNDELDYLHDNSGTIRLEVIKSKKKHSFTVNVSSTTRWEDTGIRIEKNSKITITASGRWKSDPSIDATDPNGHSSPLISDNAPMKGVNHGALVGRIGDSPAFLIGDETTFTSMYSGTLQLMINDEYHFLYDNSGALEVRVQIK